MRQSAEEPLLQLGLQAGQRELLRVQQISLAVEAHLHLQLLAAGLLCSLSVRTRANDEPVVSTFRQIVILIMHVEEKKLDRDRG